VKTCKAVEEKIKFKNTSNPKEDRKRKSIKHRKGR
jgi:hypothetical protein